MCVYTHTYVDSSVGLPFIDLFLREGFDNFTNVVLIPSAFNVVFVNIFRSVPIRRQINIFVYVNEQILLLYKGNGGIYFEIVKKKIFGLRNMRRNKLNLSSDYKRR